MSIKASNLTCDIRPNRASTPVFLRKNVGLQVYAILSMISCQDSNREISNLVNWSSLNLATPDPCKIVFLSAPGTPRLPQAHGN
jgi:hypothetical protein